MKYNLFLNILVLLALQVIFIGSNARGVMTNLVFNHDRYHIIHRSQKQSWKVPEEKKKFGRSKIEDYPNPPEVYF